jgi:hypothetical protein
MIKIMKTEKQQTAVEWLFRKTLEMEKEQRGYSKEDVIRIVEKSRETGLTAEFLLLTFKSE